jgi:hypothetical protein
MNLTIAYRGGTRFDATNGKQTAVSNQPAEDGGACVAAGVRGHQGSRSVTLPR